MSPKSRRRRDGGLRDNRAMSDFEQARQHFLNGLQAQQAGRLAEAEQCYRAADALVPGRVSVLTNLAALLLEQDRLPEALSCFKRILRSEPDNAMAIEGFAAVLRSGRLGDAEVDAEVEAVALRIFREATLRPEALMHVLKGRLLGKAEFAAWLERARAVWPRHLEFPAAGLAPWDDPLLVALLETVPVADLAIERLLVMLRGHLLDQAVRDTSLADLRFACALARQCFINEYVYPLQEAEQNAVDRLRTRIEHALALGSVVPDAWLAACASYVPLHALDGAERLLTGTPRDAAVAALIAQQIEAPFRERVLRHEIPQLTPIDDAVSDAVRQQYEENPYPRWTRAARCRQRVPFAQWVAPHVGHERAARWAAPGAPLAALTAGCGTGRQPIETASLLTDVDMLAVDLSQASLAFALRQAHDAGVTNLRFAQADILNLASLGRQFAFIDCTGVLHHLREPKAGLTVLASLLEAGGVMRIALYSEAARRSVVAVRDWIDRNNIAGDEDGIRRCRQAIMALPANSSEYQATCFADFYSMSECRDLLFHVQEHRFTIAGIRELLASARLEFAGFELEPWQLMRFRARYPDAASLDRLDHWQAFENTEPDFFAAMYQFWVRKPPAT